jgi:hypothetical protein
MTCINCGKKCKFDCCSEKCRVCQRCGVKLEPEDDLYCVLCSWGFK